MHIDDELSIRLGKSRISSWNTAGRPTGKKGMIGYNTELFTIETFDGTNWIPAWRQLDPWHAFGGFQDQSDTLAINVDTWTHITNAGNNLWTALEADGFTMTADELIVTNTGDYAGNLSVTFEGVNTKDYLFRIYNVTQSAVSGYHIGTTGKGSNNYSNVSIPIYIEATAGDHFQLQVYQVTGSDAMFLNAIFNIAYLHD